MDNALPALKPNVPLSSRLLKSRFFIPFLLVLLAAGILAAWLVFGRGAQLQANGVPISPEIEERFGIRITSIVLTAGDGLIDFRYRVLDPNKARELGHYDSTMPMLIAEDTNEVVETTAMGFHTHNVDQGRIYYALFRNTSNRVLHGSQVTVKIGDLTLKHIPIP
jgi:hypothetical protein